LAIAIAAITAPAGLAAGPDDRAQYRGSVDELAPALTVTPDDRAFSRAGPTVAPTSVSPDDRPFARGGEAEPTAISLNVAAASGFDWADAVVGLTFGLALALAGAALLKANQRRRPLGSA
jgi:hypothetical protein